MLELYTPAIEDLWFKQTMMADKSTMSYNHASGGTIPFPEERWAAWHARWITDSKGKRFYRYLVWNGTFVGEIAYHFNDESQRWLTNVLIHAPYRGKGYGRNALLLLCDAAKRNGVDALCDEIAIDNPSVALFLDCGFAEVLRTDEYVLVRKELDA